ncbi:MAG: ABC transporter ATP-binding protein [Pseudomonadota bacterium]
MSRLIATGMRVEYFTDEGIVRAVDGVDFTIKPGVRIGFVGESGSGKTTTALALMGMIEPPGKVTAGTALLDDIDLLKLSEEDYQRVRLTQISYIPQGAMNSLNPVMRIADQIIDGMIDHGLRLSRGDKRERAMQLLDKVGLSTKTARMYPHELSGGMKQRACIAIAIALGPKLIIADEPTSALDVITQRRVMETLRELQEELGASLILIGHDMGLMAQFVDDIMVMRHGKIVEQGTARTLFKHATHAYTRTLIDSVPSLHARSDNAAIGAAPFATEKSPVPEAGDKQNASARNASGHTAIAESRPKSTSATPSIDQPLLELHAVAKTYGAGLFRGPGTRALRPLTLTLRGDRPLVVSVVGQSGSGKTTLGALILGFQQPTSGVIRYRGQNISRFSSEQIKQYRREVQAVFQDPYAAYNPFYKVDHALVEPLGNFGLAAGRDQIYGRMRDACTSVGLDPAQTIHRFAHQLSGGQRQRLMVGRAIMLAPRLLIADEPVSMVDASLRSTILTNLKQMKDQQGVSILYITHDLATAYQVSDYLLVLYRGRVVEAGEAETVIKDPKHPYTQLLVDSIPWPDPDQAWGSQATIAQELAELDRHENDDATLIRSTIDGFALAA